jgi:hypothetical protein
MEVTMRKILSWTGLLWLAVIIALSSCNIFGCDNILSKTNAQNKHTLSFDQITFEKERQAWLEKGVLDYSFYLNYRGEGRSWKGTIAVKDGVVLGFVPDVSSYLDVLDEKEGLVWLNTITGIYTIASYKYQAIYYGKGDSQYTMHTKIEVEYDSEFHFPQHYYLSTSIFTPPGEFIGGNSPYDEFWITGFTINPNYADMPLRTKDLKHLLVADRLWLEYNRQQWERQDVPDYSFHLEYRDPAGKVWKGTVSVTDYAVSGFVTEESGLNELQWVDTITGIYSTILNTCQAILKEIPEKYSLKTDIEIEYNDEFHFPQRYRRATRLIIPSRTPPDEIPDSDGFNEEFFWITGFTKLE